MQQHLQTHVRSLIPSVGYQENAPPHHPSTTTSTQYHTVTAPRQRTNTTASRRQRLGNATTTPRQRDDNASATQRQRRAANTTSSVRPQRRTTKDERRKTKDQRTNRKHTQHSLYRKGGTDSVQCQVLSELLWLCDFQAAAIQCTLDPWSIRRHKVIVVWCMYYGEDANTAGEGAPSASAVDTMFMMRGK